MALQKELPTPFGETVKANYHRISRLDIDYAQKFIHGVIASYADEAARAANKNPLVQNSFEWGAPEWSFADGEPTRTAVYEKLKETEALSGAVDA